MPPLRRKLHEQVMGEVLAEIARGDYREGDPLPKETDLAEAHGVSRYVARECILALRDRGVLRVRHGVGASVAPQDEWQLYDPALLEALVTSSAREAVLDELHECRELLWPEVAAIAARRRTSEDLTRLEASAGDPAAFDAALLATARNRFLRTAAGAFERALQVAEAAGGDAEYGGVDAVLEAVRRGDPHGARAAMRSRMGAPAG